jgi:hypothetical protein
MLPITKSIEQLTKMLVEVQGTLAVIALFAVAYFATGVLVNVSRFVDACRRVRREPE